MLNEQVAHADFDLGQILGNCLLDIRGDQVTPTGRRRDGDFVLEPLHHAFGVGSCRLTDACG